ncbi:hypothetical protein JAGODDHD_01277 [Sphingomonas paucimobilis]|nr:hypothetical protein [Sphingomonas paucimobilis]SUJ35386.1 Uncharacterised protein [Sphingomonas paucimobilis]
MMLGKRAPIADYEWNGKAGKPLPPFALSEVEVHGIPSAERVGRGLRLRSALTGVGEVLSYEKGPVALPPRPLFRRTVRTYFERSTCSKSSSTGVARPKIDTDTLTLDLSKSSSSTTPLKLAKGPSSTLTASPIS